MKPTSIALVLGIAMAAAGLSSCAGSGEGGAGGTGQRSDTGMKVVANPAPAGEPGHRWRYFCDPREGRAVVISPGGDYFYSGGEGLSLVYRAAAQRATS